MELSASIKKVFSTVSSPPCIIVGGGGFKRRAEMPSCFYRNRVVIRKEDFFQVYNLERLAQVRRSSTTRHQWVEKLCSVYLLSSFIPPPFSSLSFSQHCIWCHSVLRQANTYPWLVVTLVCGPDPSLKPQTYNGTIFFWTRLSSAYNV